MATTVNRPPGFYRSRFKYSSTKGARKNAQGMITEPGNMVIYVAGYPAIMGLQPLYFKDAELARRARIPAETGAGEKTGTLAVASG